MRRMFALSVGAVAALMFVCGTARAEKKENPMYTMWAKFKPGSSATISAVSDMAGQTTKSETKTTLKSVSDDKVVLEMATSMDMGGNKMEMPPQSMDIPKMVDVPADAKPTPTDPGKDVKTDAKTAEESVTVKAGTFKAKMTETKMDQGGSKMTSKAWTSDEVPGGVVKMEVVGEGEMKMTVKSELSAMEKK